MSVAFLQFVLTWKSVTGYCIASSWVSLKEALIFVAEAFGTCGNGTAWERLGCELHVLLGLGASTGVVVCPVPLSYPWISFFYYYFYLKSRGCCHVLPSPHVENCLCKGQSFHPYYVLFQGRAAVPCQAIEVPETWQDSVCPFFPASFPCSIFR